MFQCREFLKKLEAYLVWLEDYWQGIDWDEIGRGEAACQNPPYVNEHDTYCFNWYSQNVHSFTRDYNLMPDLIKELGIKGDEKTLFLFKLNMIYRAFQNIAKKKSENK